MKRSTLTFTVALLSAVVACDDEPAAAQAPDAASPKAVAEVVEAPAEAQGLLEEGQEAPQFEAVAHTGQRIRLADLKGRPVVVYFYPKDDTPGCTAEAQGIRDLWLELMKTKVVVLGVSTQDNVSHRAFVSKHDLPFLLLPDTEHQLAKAFGVSTQNGVAERVTFVLDAEGEIVKVFQQVKPEQHAQELLAVLQTLVGK